MFIKTEVETVIEETALTRAYPAASTILGVLKTMIVDGENKYGGITVSNKDLSIACSYTPATISKGIKALKEHGFIGIAKIGRNNCYILNPDLVSMVKHGHLTRTSLDGVKIIVTSEEAEKFKLSIKELLRKRGTKQQRSAKGLNSTSVKHGNNYKVESVKNEIVVDKDTGEIL